MYGFEMIFWKIQIEEKLFFHFFKKFGIVIDIFLIK